MAVTYRDYVALGQYYTEDYLKVSDLDGSRSFDTLYSLWHCRLKTASTPGVISLTTEFGLPDTSRVFRVIPKHPCIESKVYEFTGNQTGTVLLSALSANERYIINYGSLRSDSASGMAYITDGVSKVFMTYFDAFKSATATAIYLPMEAGAALTLYSTQGSKALFVALNYTVEVV